MNTTSDPIRFLLASRHEGCGAPDYWLTRVDATLDGYADWTGTALMLGYMVAGVGPMLAGDFVRITIIRDGRIWHSFRGRPERNDKRLDRIAGQIA